MSRRNIQRPPKQPPRRRFKARPAPKTTASTSTPTAMRAARAAQEADRQRFRAKVEAFYTSRMPEKWEKARDMLLVKYASGNKWKRFEAMLLEKYGDDFADFAAHTVVSVASQRTGDAGTGPAESVAADGRVRCVYCNRGFFMARIAQHELVCAQRNDGVVEADEDDGEKYDKGDHEDDSGEQADPELRDKLAGMSEIELLEYQLAQLKQIKQARLQQTNNAQEEQVVEAVPLPQERAASSAAAAVAGGGGVHAARHLKHSDAVGGSGGDLEGEDDEFADDSDGDLALYADNGYFPPYTGPKTGMVSGTATTATISPPATTASSSPQAERASANAVTSPATTALPSPRGDWAAKRTPGRYGKIFWVNSKTNATHYSETPPADDSRSEEEEARVQEARLAALAVESQAAAATAAAAGIGPEAEARAKEEARLRRFEQKRKRSRAAEAARVEAAKKKLKEEEVRAAAAAAAAAEDAVDVVEVANAENAGEAANVLPKSPSTKNRSLTPPVLVPKATSPDINRRPQRRLPAATATTTAAAEGAKGTVSAEVFAKEHLSVLMEAAILAAAAK